MSSPSSPPAGNEGPDPARTEALLHESEARFRQISEAIQEVFWMTDPDKQVLLYVSPAYERIWGRSVASLYADPISFVEAVHPDDRERVRAAVPLQITGRYDVEYRVVRPDGTVSWVHDRAFPVRDPDGRVRRLTGIALDITDRKRADEEVRRLNAELGSRIAARTAELSRRLVELQRTQAALARSEEQYRAVIDNASEGIVVAQDERVRFVNPKALQLLGYEAGEVLGQPMLRFIHPDDHARVIEKYGRRMRGQAASRDIAVRFLRHDGSTVWIELSGVLIDWGGAPGVLTFLIDVSDRVRLEASLKQSLAEREAILESTVVGITFSVARRNQWVNRTFADMIGWNLRDIIGQSSVVHFPDEASWLAFGEAAYPVIGRGETYTAEIRQKRRDGTLLWAQVAGKGIDPADPARGAIWTFIDISSRKQAEEDIRAALAKQTELNLLKSRFIAMTSHEFRTPLATILSSAELLRHYGEKLPGEERVELFESIEQSVKRMTRMLEDVLLIGRAEADRLEFRPQATALEPLVARLVDEARAAAVSDGIDARFETTVRGDADHVELDGKLFAHILGNLLSNAAKYSPPGGTVRVEADCRAGELELVVSDEGIGIADDDLPHVFETFYRASNVGGIAGTGLGLAIVRQCVRLHGGNVRVESRLGAGTRFVVTLPARVRPDETQSADAQPGEVRGVGARPLPAAS
jgi:PAS domain S-box-containing protein